MGKFKVLFEGDRAVVIQLRDGVRTQDLVNINVSGSMYITEPPLS